MKIVKLGLIASCLIVLPAASCSQVAKIASDVIVAIASDTCTLVQDADGSAAQDPTVNLLCNTVDGKQQVPVRMARVQWNQMKGTTFPHDAGKGI